MKNNFKKILTIEKCLEKVNLVDIYLTKNILDLIKNNKNIEFLKLNIFLLSIINKNNKNSLILILESGNYKLIEDLINFDSNILNYKNTYENNLFKTLLGYDYFYNFISKKILELDRDFIIKILTNTNNFGYNFIDDLIILLNTNIHFFNSKNIEDINIKTLVNNLINISKNIYLLDNEKNTLLINKLCLYIRNENYLIDIFKIYNINNFDVYPDLNLKICIDYLILNSNFKALTYLLDKINYIEFVNIDDNIILKFLEISNISLEIKSEILLKIINKSNISKFKNNKNQNIFFWLISEYHLDKNIIINFVDFIDIYEQDIDGNSIFDIIVQKYSKNDVEFIKNKFIKQIINKNQINNIYKKINLKNILIKSDTGIFTTNIIHNLLYTIRILKINSKILTIPYFIQTLNYKSKQDLLLNMSNNEKNIINYLKSFYINYNSWLPHIILWKNKYNYWIDPNLNDFLKNSKSINFIYIKLSVYLLDNTNTRHANVIIVDNFNKIVERFEPYGEMIFNNSNDINQMIQTHIANPLQYKFLFVQPYPGFQSRSDEYARYNKTYGDPMGYCLAWSFLYLEIKMELFKIKSNINPIDFINWYIINKFSKDFKIDDINKTNKYILFIRYYARFLDSEKNKLINKFKLDPSLSYQDDIDIHFHNKIINNINNELNKICLDK